MMLLMMLLTTATAWALKTEATICSITCSSGKFHIIAGSETDSWTVGGNPSNFYWTANESHNLTNDMTITPSENVTYTGNNLRTIMGKNTVFTFTTPNKSVCITSVEFTFSGSKVPGSTHSDPGTTYTVTLDQGRDFDGFKVIFGCLSGSCGSNATWSLAQDGSGNYTVLTISGSESTGNYSTTTVGGFAHTNAPWGYDLTSATIGNGITSIGNNAFTGCTSLQRLDIQRTNDLVTLSSNGLNGCSTLQYIVAPTPALALQYKTASNWSTYEGMMRAEFGGYIFYATNEGGTPANAINNETDLRNLASAINDFSNDHELPKGNNFRQTKTITLSSTNFEPIGTSFSRYFSGTYDGGGYTISGLHISTLNGVYYYGLFGHLKNGTVKNVRLVDPSVNAGNGNNSCGSLIGQAEVSGASTTVENCVVINPNIVGSGGNKGAIIGQNENATLKNLYFYEGNLNNAIGSGDSGTNVGRARKVILGSGIGSLSPAIDPTATSLDNGFVYDNNTYYREGLALTLASNLSATGKHVVYKAGNNTLTGNTYTVNSTDGDVTLTAELVFNTYTVQFNKNHNDATGSMNNQSFTYGTAQKLTANAFTRTGYTFARWNTKADGSGTSYDNQQSVSNLTTTNGGTVTLYAQWTANQYTVTLDKQGGNGGSSSATATYDAAMPTITVPTRTGYTFGGYFTQTNGGGTQYYNADGTSAHIWDKTAATMLYAKWTVNTYTVTFHMQGGNGGTTEVTATYDAAMPTITVPTRTGYTFGGYFTQTNGGGTKYYNADGTSARTWNIAQATMLYAKWTINKYTITFDINGGTPATIAAICQDYGTTITAPANPERTGYTFAGWNPALPTTMPAEDMTVTAQWNIVNYTINYDLDGGELPSGQSNPTSFTIESPTFTLNNPTKPGYTFTGWTGSNGTTPQTTVTITKGSSLENLNYTAHYEFAQITEGDLSFVCTSGTEAKVTACNPSVTSVTIPATVSNNDGTYNVTAIDATAFSSCRRSTPSSYLRAQQGHTRLPLAGQHTKIRYVMTTAPAVLVSIIHTTTAPRPFTSSAQGP